MTLADRTAYTNLVRAQQPRPNDVTPLLKTVVDEPWTERKGKDAVKKRSGGRCELAGPTCLGVAHDVDHVFGRKGPDPHNPDRMLHLCGFGNAGGGCHQWVSQRTMGRAASIYVLEQIVGRS